MPSLDAGQGYVLPGGLEGSQAVKEVGLLKNYWWAPTKSPSLNTKHAITAAMFHTFPVSGGCSPLLFFVVVLVIPPSPNASLSQLKQKATHMYKFSVNFDPVMLIILDCSWIFLANIIFFNPKFSFQRDCLEVLYEYS